MLQLDAIYKAAHVLKEVVRRTDLIYAPQINPESTVYLKPENLQLTGSFKVRGAYYKISQLSDEEKARGVIACSAGNHAQGVALAATKCGIKSLICLPEGAPISKVEATKHYGAEVCLVPGVYDDAYQKALQLRDEKGYTFVHPFDDENVIAGQGTIGLELLEEMPDVEVVIVPIGGGGLISGVAYALKALKPSVKVYGVQALGAASMANSILHSRIERLHSVSTFADGIAVKEPGTNTFDLVNQYVDGVVTVTEDEIAAAILALIERQRIVAEGAGAVSVAAAMFNKVPVKGKKTVCLVSGGNIDVTILSRVISRGMAKSGRTYAVTLDLIDKPGQLLGVSKIVAEQGGNVISVHHERNSESADVTGCALRVVMETRNEEHIASIRQKLLDAGYVIMTGNAMMRTPTKNSYSIRANIEEAGNLLYAASKLVHPNPKDGEDYVLANIPFAQYVKADFDFAKNFMIDPRNSFVFHIGVGVAYPYGNSKMLPFEKRYFSGGANSVRGWSVRSLGPGVYKGSEDGRMDFINQAGDIKLDLNIEYRTHLFWKLNGAAFVDAGNIWTIRDDSGQEGGLFKFNEFYKQIAVAYGLGIRLDLDYLILRFDGGMKAINPVETGKKRYPVIRPRFSRDFAFHFAVGYPF